MPFPYPKIILACGAGRYRQIDCRETALPCPDFGQLPMPNAQCPMPDARCPIFISFAILAVFCEPIAAMFEIQDKQLSQV